MTYTHSVYGLRAHSVDGSALAYDACTHSVNGYVHDVYTFQCTSAGRVHGFAGCVARAHSPANAGAFSGWVPSSNRFQALYAFGPMISSGVLSRVIGLVFISNILSYFFLLRRMLFSILFH